MMHKSITLKILLSTTILSTVFMTRLLVADQLAYEVEEEARFDAAELLES